MFPVKSILTALAIAVSTPLALASAAYAQGTTVIVIDRAQVLTQSKAGQDVATKIQGIEAAMQAELQPTATQLQTEGAAIEAKTANMTPEAMRADAALKTEVENYARKANEFNRSRQIAAQELALTERKALIDLNNALVPVLREVVTENSANVILDRSSVIFSDEATDVTASVIAKMDAATPTIAVTRQKLPAQPAQQ
nr:OmpH family outer membrane protein [Hyphomonas sp. Mor2]